MTKSNAVGWFDIYVNDLKRAVSFYETVFGHKLVEMIDPTGATQMMAFPTEMNSYGAGGALTQSEYASPGAGGTVLYFSTEDCSIEESRVTEAGGKVIRPKFSIGDFGWVTLCQDTEGNIIGLSSLK